jgi:hypothetical protein
MRLLLPTPLLLLALSGCSNPLCTTQEVALLRSPDGRHQATMFMRECGATTDFTTQVSVDAGYFHAIGNAFVADGYNGGTRGAWGGPWANMRWIGPAELLVSYDGKARIFTRNDAVKGVRISYQPVHR